MNVHMKNSEAGGFRATGNLPGTHDRGVDERGRGGGEGVTTVF